MLLWDIKSVQAVDVGAAVETMDWSHGKECPLLKTPPVPEVGLVYGAGGSLCSCVSVLVSPSSPEEDTLIHRAARARPLPFLSCWFGAKTGNVKSKYINGSERD